MNIWIHNTFEFMCVKVKVAQSCPTLWDPVYHVILYHGILQARTLEWVAFSSSRGFSQPRDQTQVSSLAGRFVTEPQGSPRILEWVAYPFSRGSSWPRNWTGDSCIAGRFFANWAIREALLNSWYEFIPIKYGTIGFTYWGSPKKVYVNLLFKQAWKPLWATTGLFNRD